MSILFAYSDLLDRAIPIEENEVPVLLVENRTAFRSLLLDFQIQKSGLSGQVLFSCNGKDLKFTAVDFLGDVVNLDLNSKSLLTKLISSLEHRSAQEDYVEQVTEINHAVQELLLLLSEDFDVGFTFADQLDMKALLKICGIRFSEIGSEYLECLCNYLLLSRILLKTEVFVLVNLKLILNEEELKNLYQFLEYHKIKILLLEGVETDRLPIEKYYIIDQDLCVIY